MVATGYTSVDGVEVLLVQLQEGLDPEDGLGDSD